MAKAVKQKNPLEGKAFCIRKCRCASLLWDDTDKAKVTFVTEDGPDDEVEIFQLSIPAEQVDGIFGMGFDIMLVPKG